MSLTPRRNSDVIPRHKSGKAADRISARPAKAGEGGPGLATTHSGDGARHDQARGNAQ